MSKRVILRDFAEPKENYCKYPNDWFDFWAFVRSQVGPRFVTLLKLVEYVLMHTWGMNNPEGKVRLSANEIHSGRRKKKNERWDAGVGISENSVRKAGDMLVRLGVLIIHTDTRDKARKTRSYQLKMRKDSEQVSVDILANGFPSLEENYFKVSKAWINAIRNISSAAVILAVEYLMRHAWGYQNPKGVWLTAEEVAHGRKQANGKLYDTGTGFALDTIKRALTEAANLGLLVWKEHYEDGVLIREYNLHFQGMKADHEGQIIEAEADANDDVADANEDVSQNANEGASDVIEDVPDAIEDVADAIEGRSLKDTLNDTQERHVVLTPTTPDHFGQSERHSTEKEHPHVVGADYNKKQKPNVSGKLPEEITEALRAIGWADRTTEIRQLFESNPNFLKAWLDYSQKIPQNEVKKTRAALFRYGIRTGVFPPELPDYNEYFNNDEDNTANEPEIHLPNPQNKYAQHVWTIVLGQLKLEMPRASYDTWVRDTYALTLHGSLLIVCARNTYVRDWLKDRLSSMVSRLLVGILNQADAKVQFVVGEPVA